MQMSLFQSLFDEEIAAFSGFQEAQVKCQFCAGAGGFQLIQQFLVINGLRAFSKWTFFIYIFNATRQGISRHLTFVEATERLDLARQAVRPRKDRSLPEKIFT